MKIKIKRSGSQQWQQRQQMTAIIMSVVISRSRNKISPPPPHCIVARTSDSIRPGSADQQTQDWRTKGTGARTDAEAANHDSDSPTSAHTFDTNLRTSACTFVVSAADRTHKRPDTSRQERNILPARPLHGAHICIHICSNIPSLSVCPSGRLSQSNALTMTIKV